MYFRLATIFFLITFFYENTGWYGTGKGDLFRTNDAGAPYSTYSPTLNYVGTLDSI